MLYYPPEKARRGILALLISMKFNWEVNQVMSHFDMNAPPSSPLKCIESFRVHSSLSSRRVVPFAVPESLIPLPAGSRVFSAQYFRTRLIRKLQNHPRQLNTR
jgi:hypothetical protein